MSTYIVIWHSAEALFVIGLTYSEEIAIHLPHPTPIVDQDQVTIYMVVSLIARHRLHIVMILLPRAQVRSDEYSLWQAWFKYGICLCCLCFAEPWSAVDLTPEKVNNWLPAVDLFYSITIFATHLNGDHNYWNVNHAWPTVSLYIEQWIWTKWDCTFDISAT